MKITTDPMAAARSANQTPVLQPDRRLAALHYLRAQGRATRREIADHLGMSASVVSRLISELIGQGLIAEEGRSDSAGGRPSDLLALSPEAGYVIGLDLGSVRQIAVLVNLRGEIVATAVEPTQISAERPVILANIERLIADFLRTAEVDRGRVLGIGVGLHTLVDPIDGTVHGWANMPIWSEAWAALPLRDALASYMPTACVAIEDTVRTLGIAEASYGQGGNADFVFVQADTGIGMALMIDGKPYLGPTRIAGEIGHIPVGPAAVQCVCGNVGCLEAVASTTAIVERAKQLLGSLQVHSTLRKDATGLTISAIITADTHNDQIAYRVLNEAGEYLGSALAIVLNLLGPQRVVIGGTLAASPTYLDAARRVMRLRALERALQGVTLNPSALDAQAGAWGAATLALNMVFSSEETQLLLGASVT